MRTPSFPFYPRDWLASEMLGELRAENPRAYCLYLDLLCRSWLSEPPATLPMEHGKLAALGFVSRADFEELWPHIERQFESDLETERIFNPKLMEIWKRQQRAFINGSKGGKPKNPKANPNRNLKLNPKPKQK